MDFSFLKNIFSGEKSPLNTIFKTPSFVGIDIGLDSVKVVQLKKEDEHAVLETYGQLKSAGYLKTPDTAATASGVLRFVDDDIISMLKDVLKEAKVTSKSAAMSIPAHTSFITLAELPKVPPNERASVLSFEARRYIPIPQAEVFTNWVVIEGEEESPRMKVLFVAVPRDVVAKYQRVAKAVGLDLRAIEIDSFSSVRSLVGTDRAPTLLIHLNSQATTASIIDEGIIRVNHTIDRGQESFTGALATGLNVSRERAEELKNEIGLSENIEQQDIVSILQPLVEMIFREIERIMIAYNRETERKIEKVILTGGGSRLKGVVEYAAKVFGLEVSVGNSFRKTVYPKFMQPILRDVSPHFSVAVGLALREISEH